MNLFLQLLVLPFLGTVTAPPDEEIDSSQDKIKVEKAVVAWADSTFYSHVNYKFENFHAEYSDEYFIAVMRAQGYKERVTDLEAEKSAGRYDGTQAEYDQEHKELNDAWLKVQAEADNFTNRADHYIIHFWSNIATTDGITVYYEHICKLNNAYQVTDATINSAIGKKDENTKPIYKSDLNGDSKKKVNSTTTGTTTTGSATDTNPGGNGSVGISYETPVEATPTTTAKPKKEKKKKK